ncbi:archaeosortase/exosortase family protein [Cytophaga aurantiaca]|uniref:exosortase/archaeosortase family protein n=1 Tax=Cytophaga aurantiaca TaxID=29530 RepID=UPI0003790822
MFLLKIVGFETRHTLDTVGILGKNGVHIAYPCLGIEIMIAFIALFYAFPGSKKRYFVIFGLIGIHCLNIIRIFSIILLNKQLPNIVDLTHTLFNFFSYLLILSLFYVWYKKHSESKF